MKRNIMPLLLTGIITLSVILTINIFLRKYVKKISQITLPMKEQTAEKVPVKQPKKIDFPKEQPEREPPISAKEPLIN